VSKGVRALVRDGKPTCLYKSRTKRTTAFARTAGEGLEGVVFPDMTEARDGDFRKRLLDQSRSVLEARSAVIGQFYMGGWTVTNFSLSHYMKADVSVFIPLCYLFVTLTIWLVFRNLRLKLVTVQPPM